MKQNPQIPRTSVRKIREERKKTTGALTLSAILAAATVVLLWIGSVVDVLDLSVCVIASMLSVVCVVECRKAFPILLWIVSSALSLILLPNKYPALLYAAFAGIYPILKNQFELYPTVFCWAFKLSTFNTSLTVVIILTQFVFSSMTAEGPELRWLVYLIGNAFFVFYDVVLSRLILIYFHRIRPKLGLGDVFAGKRPEGSANGHEKQ